MRSSEGRGRLEKTFQAEGAVGNATEHESAGHGVGVGVSSEVMPRGWVRSTLRKVGCLGNTRVI